MSLERQQSDLHILIGFDGSEHSQAAIRLACDLREYQAGTVSMHVHLLAIFTPRQIDHYPALERAVRNAQKYLEERNVQASSQTILGDPAERLVASAKEERPDLILIGAKGLRSTLGILLGGVAQQVVEHAPCPVLVVRAPYTGFARVLLVTDGSSHSQYALQYTIRQLPLPSKATLQVIHVLPPAPIQLPAEVIAQTWPIGPEFVAPPPEPPTERELGWQREEEEQGRALLDKTVASLKSAGKSAESFLLRGDAASVILQHIGENQVDLVIAGSRGLSQFQSWLLGSLSRKLVHYAPCSVLLIKRPDQEN